MKLFYLLITTFFLLPASSALGQEKYNKEWKAGYPLTQEIIRAFQEAPTVWIPVTNPDESLLVPIPEYDLVEEEVDPNKKYIVKETMEVNADKVDYKKAFAFTEKSYPTTTTTFIFSREFIKKYLLTPQQIARLNFLYEFNPAKAARKEARMVQNALLNLWKHPEILAQNLSWWPPNLLATLIAKIPGVDSAHANIRGGFDTVEYGKKKKRGFEFSFKLSVTF
jgi:hypothetical protein